MSNDLDARPRIAGPVLPIVDAAVLVLFVIIGLTNHDEGITLSGIARTALPILGAWFLVAPFARTYTRPGVRTLLITWAIAVPIGVVVRAVILDRPADGSQVAFAMVALTMTLIFLLAGRGLTALVMRRSR